MSQRRQRPYRRLDRAERAAIERGLDKNRPARAMARDLGRSQSSVADEVRRNRTVTRGPGKGSRVESVPEGACARLRGWPHVCNGCNKRRYRCSMPFRCEYSAARAQLLADGELSAARRGVDRTEEEFESIAAKIRADLARGLSPAQIADARSSEFRAAPSTIYRWIERGYAGMSNMDLRRKVGYRPRRRAAPAPTPHGPERSFSAFSALPEGEREAACEDGHGDRARRRPAVRPHALPALLPRAAVPYPVFGVGGDDVVLVGAHAPSAPGQVVSEGAARGVHDARPVEGRFRMHGVGNVDVDVDVVARESAVLAREVAADAAGGGVPGDGLEHRHGASPADSRDGALRYGLRLAPQRLDARLHGGESCRCAVELFEHV